MKRFIPGLHNATETGDDGLDGSFLVRVERATYRWHSQKPFFEVRFKVLEPEPHAGRIVSGRLCSTPRALWKLNWFLRDFGYDTDLLGRDEIDEKALVGLCGIIEVSHTRLNGRSFLNLERFGPTSDWKSFSVAWIPAGKPEIPQ